MDRAKERFREILTRRDIRFAPYAESWAANLRGSRAIGQFDRVVAVTNERPAMLALWVTLSRRRYFTVHN